MEKFKKSYWYDGKLMKMDRPYKEEPMNNVYILGTPVIYQAKILKEYCGHKFECTSTGKLYDAGNVEVKSTHNFLKIICKTKDNGLNGLKDRYVFPIYHAKLGVSIFDASASNMLIINNFIQNLNKLCISTIQCQPDNYNIVQDQTTIYDDYTIEKAKEYTDAVIEQYMDSLILFEEIIEQEESTVQHGQKEPTRLRLPNGNPALRCDKCTNDFEFAEPNCPNGSFICGGCKIQWN